MSRAFVVSIGTSHPWNIAGVGLDARVACEYGVRNLTVLTGTTAQDAAGLHLKHTVPVRMVRAQLEALPRDDIGALRIGALFDEENVREVARYVEQSGVAVVDPVFSATLGGSFSNDRTVLAFRENLLQSRVVLTPNAKEAARLTMAEVQTEEQMIAAAEQLRSMGPRAVLLKGADLQMREVVDVLVVEQGVKIYRQERLPGSMRGAGCTLAMALACELAAGRDVVAAVEAARAYVRRKIEARIMLGSLQVAF
ncbi:MAG: hypothetical protein DLM50_00265 [Candidatus Meridianibacter frigidus]|nr:MAG: hypothetical protein DLM50_00265 [Candidatus Eremiobacteraeota bacterium]